MRRGLGLSVLNTGVSRLGTLLAGIVVARLLAPEDYGVFAVALVVLNALLSINELGVSLAIVRWPTDPRRIVPTVLTMALAGSLGLYMVILVTAPALADLLGSPQATTLVRVLALSAIVDGLTSVPGALLNRAFLQGRRLAADVAGLVVSSGLTVGLAVAGAGAWSLVAGYLAGNVATAVLMWLLASVRARFGYDAGIARELLGFGLPLAGSSLLAFGVLNVDYVVVGSILGPVALGFYLLAFNLSSWPVNMFSTAVRRVALAGFARIGDDRAALQDGFARALALLLGITLPVCALLAVLAGPVVRVVYGSQWAHAADALRWLAVLAASRVAFELAYDVLVARARSRAVFIAQGLWLATLAPALVVGAHVDGIRGVAVGHALVAVAVVTPVFVAALARAGVTSRAALRYTARPALATAGLVAVTATLRPLMPGDLLGLVVPALAGGLLAALVLLPLLKLARPRPATPQG
jgi:PST family polysaccharide transporter